MSFDYIVESIRGGIDLELLENLLGEELDEEVEASYVEEGDKTYIVLFKDSEWSDSDMETAEMLAQQIA